MELGELLGPGSFVEQQHVACKLCVVVWPCLTGCGTTRTQGAGESCLGQAALVSSSTLPASVVFWFDQV
jgi:hypothetical protein